ncbi:MAG: hypothetical protein KAR47_19460 [Planctomycetes bacterium]|nr:hypothetical protein [Planctomycetota bacterium]
MADALPGGHDETKSPPGPNLHSGWSFLLPLNLFLFIFLPDFCFSCHFCANLRALEGFLSIFSPLFSLLTPCLEYVSG